MGWAEASMRIYNRASEIIVAGGAARAITSEQGHYFFYLICMIPSSFSLSLRKLIDPLPS